MDFSSQKKCWIFTLLFCLVVSVSACSGRAGTTAPTPVPVLPAVKLTPIAHPTESDPTTAIFNALQGMDARANRKQSSTSYPSGLVMNITDEYAPPDRHHITGEGLEMILAGGRVFYKGSSGWVETTSAAANAIIAPDLLYQLKRNISLAQFTGAEKTNDAPMWQYTYLNTLRVGDRTQVSRTSLWVGQSDSLPYRMEILNEVPQSTSSTRNVTGGTAITTVTIAYDASIKIESPLP